MFGQERKENGKRKKLETNFRLKRESSRNGDLKQKEKFNFELVIRILKLLNEILKVTKRI